MNTNHKIILKLYLILMRYAKNYPVMSMSANQYLIMKTSLKSCN